MDFFLKPKMEEDTKSVDVKEEYSKKRKKGIDINGNRKGRKWKGEVKEHKKGWKRYRKKGHERKRKLNEIGMEKTGLWNSKKSKDSEKLKGKGRKKESITTIHSFSLSFSRKERKWK